MTSKILMVDDEIDLQNLINAKFRKAIKNEEMKFYFALNGLEALNILEKEPDLNIIITDIRMPIMDGLTLLANLPNLKRPYKAVVASAYGDISNIRTAMNLGAADFIIKPFDFEDFEVTLRKIINEYSILTTALIAESSFKELQIELNVAKTIQEGMLPYNFQPLPHLEIAGRMIPAKMVGGDFFDFFPINEHKLAIIIADVSGKGVSASLYMAIAKSIFRAFSDEKISCSEVVKKVNNFLGKDSVSCLFVTAFYAVLDINTGELTYCNAGHNPPYIVRADGSIQKVDSSSGPALGVDETFFHSAKPYLEFSLNLNNKDSIFLYTDGVTEAWSSSNELFSESRLEETLSNSVGKTSGEVVEAVTNAVMSFSENIPQSDDITMLAIRYLPDQEDKRNG